MPHLYLDQVWPTRFISSSFPLNRLILGGMLTDREKKLWVVPETLNGLPVDI